MTLEEKGRKPTPDTPATGVGASLEYRVVQTHTTGKRHVYPKRNLDRAQKMMAEWPGQQQRSIYSAESSIHLEQREVGPWTTIGDTNG